MDYDAARYLAESIGEQIAMNLPEFPSLRDQFAMAALTGNLAYSHVNPSSGNFQENCSVDQLAECCYGVADAMMEARKKGADA